MSVVAAAVRSSVAVLASSVLVVTMVTPSAAEPAVVQADPDLTVVLGAPTSTPAETLFVKVPAQVNGQAGTQMWIWSKGLMTHSEFKAYQVR